VGNNPFLLHVTVHVLQGVFISGRNKKEVAHCLIVGANIMGGQSREGEVTWPLMTTYGAKFEMTSELSFFKGGAGYCSHFTPNAISSYWGTIGRLGELILMLENLIK
jgi:hypothetical protein